MSQAEKKGPQRYSGPSRVRYFNGMLLDEKDFQDEQTYHISRRRLLNRMLYGSGVVCGLDLERLSSTEFQIGPGLALDCKGHEIWLPKEHRIDICELEGVADRAELDPCDYPKENKDRTKYHICVEYAECATDPSPNHVGDGECATKGCDHTRVREGYRVGLAECTRPETQDGLLSWIRGEAVRQQLDDAYPADARGERLGEGEYKSASSDRSKWLEEFCCAAVPCPCGSDCGPQCIVVGSITLDGNGCLVDVCSNDCRKYVLTGHMLGHLFVSIFGTRRREGDSWEPAEADMVANPLEALCYVLSHYTAQQSVAQGHLMAEAHQMYQHVRDGEVDRALERFIRMGRQKGAGREPVQTPVQAPRQIIEQAYAPIGLGVYPSKPVIVEHLANNPGILARLLDSELKMPVHHRRKGVLVHYAETARRLEDERLYDRAAVALAKHAAWEADGRPAAESV